MGNIALMIIIISIIFFAILKIILEKKKGIKCIGCPYSEKCKKSYNRLKKEK